MVTEVSLRVTPREAYTVELLRKAVARKLGLPPQEINDLRITHRSIDARQRKVMVNVTVKTASGDDREVAPLVQPPAYQDVRHAAMTVVIVGAGPAGLFAALRCLAKGIRPIVLERGDDVDTRRKKLADISRKGHLDPESNYCFGEGGAGAYSDGKLYTRSKKRGSVTDVLTAFVAHGASEDILIDAHPHIGSNRLPDIIASMRESIREKGGEVYFRSKVTELLLDGDSAQGVLLEDGRRIEGDAVILATGHGARDVYEMLHRKGVDIEAKGLAIGVRLEHPQEVIDRIQYHDPKGRGEYLPAAEYQFVTQVDGRGVYSFCMCPGGVIVPAATERDGLVVNGMSAAGRSGRWANSGMVVEIHPEDFPEYSQYGALCTMKLQQDLERRFFAEAGNSFNAAAQRMTDFVAGRPSKSLLPTSYAPGIHPARVDLLLPPFISDRLRRGFEDFGRKRKGFLTDRAQVIGLESRTSSPLRVIRDSETLQHIRIRNLYPAGEGAGYAGGIVSAAMDGIRCIDSFIKTMSE